MHEHSYRQRLRSITAMLVAATCALAMSGCASDEQASSKTSKPAKLPPAAKPGVITPPTSDAALTKAVGDSGAQLTDAGCSFGVLEEESALHVAEPEELRFQAYPPNSGTHFADWAPFGLYDKPVDDGYVVHNLEHGGVVVWLGSAVGDDETEAVAELLDDGEKWIVTPRPDFEGLYSAAWGRGLSCPPAALEQLSATELATALDAWFEAVQSTGSEAEKDVAAYAGAMKEPTPTRDISEDSPF